MSAYIPNIDVEKLNILKEKINFSKTDLDKNVRQDCEEIKKAFYDLINNRIHSKNTYRGDVNCFYSSPLKTGHIHLDIGTIERVCGIPIVETQKVMKNIIDCQHVSFSLTYDIPSILNVFSDVKMKLQCTIYK